jgi:hypothetical protein
LWCGGGEIFVEIDDEKMFNPQIADQLDFMLRGSQQMGCVVRPQYFDWMWIERYDNGRSGRRACMSRGGGDDGLMTAMDAIEDSNSKKKRAAQFGQFGD